MSLQEVIGPVARWDREGRRTCLALLFKVEGSSPRPPGARLAINDRGDLAGYISLGCVEGDVREHIRQILAGGPARVVHYGLVEQPDLAVGLSCGGHIDVLLALHDPADAAWRALCAPGLHRPAVLCTRLDPPSPGRMWLREATGAQHGTLGDPGLDEQALRETSRLDEQGPTSLLTLAGVSCFAELLLPSLRLILVGATPVASALCKLASAIGWEVTVIDPRREFANEQTFPSARQILLKWPEEGLAEAGANPQSFVAVLSHDPKLDVPGLAAALRANCRYIGLLGGRVTQARRREALAAMGFGLECLARVRGPIGLRIGSIAPDEIAVSILAEIIAVSRGPIRAAASRPEKG